MMWKVLSTERIWREGLLLAYKPRSVSRRPKKDATREQEERVIFYIVSNTFSRGTKRDGKNIAMA